MKLLFDENLSHKLALRLGDLFPNSVHVRDVGLKSANDPSVWEYAKSNGFIIVSKDSDMHDRSFFYGYPPKVIWIRLGNCSTFDGEDLLRDKYGNNILDELSILFHNMTSWVCLCAKYCKGVYCAKKLI